MTATQTLAHAGEQEPGLQLRQNGTDRLVLAYGVLWLIYVVTQFRMPWTPLSHDGSTTTNMRQAFFTIGVVLAVRRMIYTRTLNQLLGMHLGGLLLGGMLLASVVWSTNTTLTIKRSLVYVFGYLMLIALVHIPRHPMRFFMTAVVHATGWIAWISILAHWLLPAECTTLTIRPGLAGLSSHPNVFGPCLEMAWGLALGLPTWSRSQKAHKWLMMIGLIVALVMSNSVTALLATAVGTLVYFGLTTSNYRAGALILATIAAGTIAQVIGIANLKAAFFGMVGRDATMSGRDELWTDVLDYGMASPILGGGYGAFWYEGRGLELTGTWNPRQAHNSYLDVFVDLGVLGLLLILVVVHYQILIGFWRHGARRGTRQRCAVAALVSMSAGLLCIGAFGESFLLKLDKFQFFVLFWGVMLLENRDRNHITAEFAALDVERPTPTR